MGLYRITLRDPSGTECTETVDAPSMAAALDRASAGQVVLCEQLEPATGAVLERLYLEEAEPDDL